MKVAYFSQSPVRMSETFFSFLIKGLEKKLDRDSFYHIVGTTQGSKIAADTVFSGFYYNKLWLRRLYELQERLGHPQSSALKYMQRQASKRLSRVPELRQPVIAYVEYGKTATRVYKFLVAQKIPFVVHFHGKDASADFSSRFYTNEIRKVFDASVYIVTASQHIRRLLILKGCDPAKIKVIRYGIEVEKLNPLSWEARRKGPPSVVFLGRLTEKKNPIALLHAFQLVKQKIPDARLTIIGDGKLRDQVKERIQSLSLSDSVSLTGAMVQDQALEVMNKHWLYAQHNVTSVDGDQEGYVLSTAEAAALQLPVVTTLHNGIPEHVIDGTTGFLVQEYDYESMAEKMIEVLSDPGLAEAFGNNGRQNISKINNPTRRIEEIYTLLQQAFQLVYN